MMRCTAIRRAILASLAGLTLAVMSPANGHGQGWIEPIGPDHRRIGVERIRSEVTIEVDGDRRVAEVVVEEEFRNRSGALLEGDYLYPIPSTAVFTDFSLFAGERELKGEVLPAGRARRIYEEIVRRRKDPALIELVGHGLLRARVFPVGPGQTRRVVLRYTQILGRDGDLLRLRYPRVIGMLPDEQYVEVAHRQPRQPAPQRFDLRVRIRDAAQLATPYSPTHSIEVQERSDGVEVRLDDNEDASARDFELFLPLREAFIGADIVTHAPRGEPGYFMLLISPPAAPDELQIARDVTVVLDVSGSMSGEKIEQAREALDQILGGLRPADRFRLITFSSVVRSFRTGFANADPETVRAARAYLADVRAEGSTNIMDALNEALAPTSPEERLSLVIFLTDGKPTVGETAPERIAARAAELADRERVFSFGVGYDVNTYLLDRLSETGRGAVSYVRPGMDVEVAVSSLTRKLRFPALSDLRIVDAPARLEDYFPNPLPDLFYGEELVLFGRYRGAGHGQLVLEASRAGRQERFRYEVELAEHEPDNRFIPRLWAARKVGALTARMRLHGSDPELVQEIRDLALRYGIITEYTSYLVEEPELAFNRAPEEDMARARALDAAPEAQTGAAAFRRAERSQRLAQAPTVGAADAVVATYAEGEGGRNPRAARARHAGDRLFVLRDGVWTDTRFEPALRIVRVQPFSDAYFELLHRVPELRPYFALGDRVLVVGDGMALALEPDGLSSWDGRGLDDVARALEVR